MHNNHLDIIINYKESQYEATCASFPNCKATGSTEEEALDKLSQTIGNAIARQTKAYLKKVFQNKNHLHRVINPENTNSQHRLYPYEASKLPFSEKVLLKLQHIIPTEETPVPQTETLFDLAQEDDAISTAPDSDAEEGYMLGLSLGLN